MCPIVRRGVDIADQIAGINRDAVQGRSAEIAAQSRFHAAMTKHAVTAGTGHGDSCAVAAW